MVLSAETNLSSATNVSSASVVRIFNSDSSAATVTKKDSGGSIIGSFTMSAGEVVYSEKDDVAEAKEDLFDIETEMKALNTATSIEIDQAEAILRVEIGSTVDKMSSAEIKRDLYLFARNNPVLFLDLVSDENVVLRNLAIKANESGVIRLSQDQRSFTWGSNDRKLMEVPFDENPYSAFAAWLKTDEGVEVYKSIQKKLN